MSFTDVLIDILRPAVMTGAARGLLAWTASVNTRHRARGYCWYDSRLLNAMRVSSSQLSQLGIAYVPEQL